MNPQDTSRKISHPRSASRICRLSHAANLAIFGPPEKGRGPATVFTASRGPTSAGAINFEPRGLLDNYPDALDYVQQAPARLAELAA